jgi:hypothetical protein
MNEVHQLANALLTIVFAAVMFAVGHLYIENKSTRIPAIPATQAFMPWTNPLELQVKPAIALDPSLLDAEAVGEAIFRARYGDERWEKRVARTIKHGVGVLEYPFAGKKKKAA